MFLTIHFIYCTLKKKPFPLLIHFPFPLVCHVFDHPFIQFVEKICPLTIHFPYQYLTMFLTISHSIFIKNLSMYHSFFSPLSYHLSDLSFIPLQGQCHMILPQFFSRRYSYRQFINVLLTEYHFKNYQSYRSSLDFSV